MQVTVTSAEGLKRQLKVVIPAGELGERFNKRLGELQPVVQLKGFRKGKVPATHIKKVFGRSIMAEALQTAVDESTRQAIADRNERPAIQPKIDLPEDEAVIERVLSGQDDFAFDMTFEVLPEITVTDLESLKLTRLVADVEDAAVDEALARIAERNTRYEPEEGRVAASGDRITIDFVGKIDGTAFENGSGEDAQIVIGQGGFIPGFEDGLVGAKAGEERNLDITFPAEYPAEHLKGKAAVFEVKVKEVAKPVKPAIDDEFAKTLGAESLDKLREMVSGQIKREYDQLSRGKLKRALLDELDKLHDFQLPPSLVEAEFEGVWQQVTQGLERAKKTFADEGKTEDGARAEYRKIAERRVRLGLLIGDIGEKHKVEVNQDELRRSLIEQARSFPGQERMVYDYYQNNPQALASLRAPVFEDKVVDLIIDLAKPIERKVSREELMQPEPDEAAEASGAAT